MVPFKHYMVNVCGENVLFLAPPDATIAELKARAIMKYFDLHPEKVYGVEQLETPCQWGGECPEGASNCMVCASIMANE